MIESESDTEVPTIFVGNQTIPVNEVSDEHIAQMTPQEKETYIQVYQEFYSHLY